MFSPTDIYLGEKLQKTRQMELTKLYTKHVDQQHPRWDDDVTYYLYGGIACWMFCIN